jgi:hypothetical protein
MQKYPEIKRFVQETLGCSCPEEVFEKIDCQEEREGASERKVSIGGRLLIYIITTDSESDIQGVITSALERGVVERDKKGFNRFRLVLVASRPDELRGLAEQAFAGSGYTDSKTHIHVVSERDVESF